MTDNRALWELVEEMDIEARFQRRHGDVGMAEELHIYTAKLREILERPVVAGGWLPIESAPKDRMIMLGRPADDEREGISLPGFWDEAIEDGVDYMGNDGGFVDFMFQTFYCGRSFGQPRYQHGGFQPTHWRELHAAPETAESMVRGKS
jgi:hypothetical protein